ncbi:beta family protein [Aquibacillus sp. 3ASR75-11]|uniref:Beta family protein n=1 Tax=Terrihalobacillus insolitus TaxID=2950438 RepID=A0A9X3WUC2_9BACI|nr:hypothetical protein [Terrihalobacillus insolitus]MDC3411855.1 beta family protein [Terrihalobacillus insolitus]MDC3423469.1 beta family protein [Terrihalobacillus insolitus]
MYMPVIKNRTVEMNVLKKLYQIPISPNIVPMIEMIQLKTKSNSNKDLTDELEDIFCSNDEKRPFLIDIVKKNVPNNTTAVVRDFLTRVNRKPGYYEEIVNKFAKLENAIPVVSYNPNSYDPEDIENDVETLKDFNNLAFRVTSNTFKQAFLKVKELIKNGDYLVLDIGLASHLNPALRRMYIDIQELKSKVNFTSIILNSTKSSEVTNVSLEDGEPIFTIDNSLRDTYSRLHQFDGFGDYACIVNDLPSKGGGISPAGIYYSYQYNYFIGYRRNKDLAEFENYIAPKIVSSEYWSEFSEDHHQKCPGCQLIYSISRGEEPGKSQAKWKGITMFHYIYTLSEKEGLQ